MDSASLIELKNQLHEQCGKFLDAQIANLRTALKDARESGNDETKSTTGDKHETGRAMMQIEQEKIGFQLAALDVQKRLLEKIDVVGLTDKVRPGSVIFTTHGNFFLAIAAGTIMEGKLSFTAVSAISPIGKMLIGKSSGDEFLFNGRNYRIDKVV